MKLSELEKKIFKELKKLEIIDCHEHLSPERDRIKNKVDFFTLFSHYTHGDLLRAGMSEETYSSLFNRDIPIEDRWEKFAPYWENIRHTSYARAILISIEKLYDIKDINEKTYKKISEAIEKTNKEGLYENVLGKICNIKTSLNQCGRTDLGTPRLTPVMPMVYELENWKPLSQPPFAPHLASTQRGEDKGEGEHPSITSLDDYLDAVKSYVLRVKSEGAVGLKMMSNPYGKPDYSQATSLFNELKSDPEKRLPVPNPLRDFVVDWIIKFAGEQGLVIAVHTGYWGDFRQLHPLHVIPLLERHPQVKFDIYHLGYPWVRDTLMLGKGFSNVWLNLCWLHIISQKCAIDALDEAIDLIPANKILAFGGDYSVVEKVYGHLTMAREDIARVLAKRIKDGDFSKDRALKLAQKWLFENPGGLYNLK